MSRTVAFLIRIIRIPFSTRTLSLLVGPVEHTGNGIDTQTLRGVVVANQKIASTTTVIEISMHACLSALA